METQIPQIPQQPARMNFTGQMSVQGHPPMMMGMRPNSMISPYNILPEQEEKKR